MDHCAVGVMSSRQVWEVSTQASPVNENKSLVRMESTDASSQCASQSEVMLAPLHSLNLEISFSHLTEQGASDRQLQVSAETVVRCPGVQGAHRRVVSEHGCDAPSLQG